MFLTVCTTVSTLYNTKKLGFYSECMGRQEEFLFSLPNFFEERPYTVNRIDLPFLSPYRIFINLQTFSFVFIVPIFYTLIYIFRKHHDLRITGNKRIDKMRNKKTLIANICQEVEMDYIYKTLFKARLLILIWNAMVFKLNLDIISLKKLFPTMNI